MTVPVTHFSYWVASDKNNPLPVLLPSLNGSSFNRDVIINWSTSQEFGNEGFEVQKCLIKNEVQGDLEKSGYVKGNGTKSEPSEYTFKESKCNS